MSRKYVMEMGLPILLRDMNVSPQDVLRQAQLPLDLLSRKAPMLTAEEYFRLWNALTYILRDVPNLPLLVGMSISVEVFSPPLFACFCSPNLNIALKRLGQYKPLVGPLKMDLAVDDFQTTQTIMGLVGEPTPPPTLLAMELVFMVQLARLATREQIVPRSVQFAFDLPDAAAYEDFFGVPVKTGATNALTFSAFDAQLPFLTANDAMWSIFEPQLQTRLKDLQKDASFRERMRATLIEIIASGQTSMDDVAAHLAVSTRTLQRRLREEGTNFQAELDSVREELARNYLGKSDYSSGQIAFLLGYQDPNSFFRAFRGWTGQTPEVVRAGLQNH